MFVEKVFRIVVFEIGFGNGKVVDVVFEDFELFLICFDFGYGEVFGFLFVLIDVVVKLM